MFHCKGVCNCFWLEFLIFYLCAETTVSTAVRAAPLFYGNCLLDLKNKCLCSCCLVNGEWILASQNPFSIIIWDVVCLNFALDIFNVILLYKLHYKLEALSNSRFRGSWHAHHYVAAYFLLFSLLTICTLVAGMHLIVWCWEEAVGHGSLSQQRRTLCISYASNIGNCLTFFPICINVHELLSFLVFIHAKNNFTREL